MTPAVLGVKRVRGVLVLVEELLVRRVTVEYAPGGIIVVVKRMVKAVLEGDEIGIRF